MIASKILENSVLVDGKTIDVGAPILDAQTSASVVLVLIDPDSYLMDADYRKKRRAGLPAVRNLRAYSRSGVELWKAEMPEQADYYCKIVSSDPIEVDSFSSYRCRIDPATGSITSKKFLK